MKKKKYLPSWVPPNSLIIMNEFIKTMPRMNAKRICAAKLRTAKLTNLIWALILTSGLVAAPVSANGLKLTDLIGHPVETDGGDPLGSIEDFSIDTKTGSLQFVVISIGSFLIENSLIAVEPGALTRIANGDPVVLRMEDLEVAHRFNADNWPDRADVRSVALADGESSAQGTTGNSGNDSTALSATGSATITAGSKKAIYQNGKRELVNGPIRRASQTSTRTPATTPRVDRVVPNFKNLDRNNDGRLSRAEIGAELTQRSGFGALDSDANGAIDDFEYQAYREQQANQRRWTSNR